LARYRENNCPQSPLPTLAGRDDLRAHGPIFRAMGEYRPGDACMLGCKGDGNNIHMSALLQSSRPCALRIGFLVDDAQVRSRAVYQQGPQISVALARDLSKPFLAAARILSGRDPRRGRVASAALEHVRVTHTGDQRCCGLWSDRLDAHEPSRRLTGFSKCANPAVVRRDSRVEVMKLIEQTGQSLARECRQAIPIQ
jgi:hypothetical protein